ncbi:MAG: amidohydrolase family protein, partial [Balneolaceae bacterium]|nr:amidohydrolase family protein [Balneolaceae bacterium]
MKKIQYRALLILPFLLILLTGCAQTDEAEYIIQGGHIWTGSDDFPQVEAVAVRAGVIIAVGSKSDIARFDGAGTTTIDADGGMVVPGFIDNHTHFNRAGELLMGINLLDVSDSEGLRERVAETAERLPEGMWMTGGMCGAYEQWEMGGTGTSEDEREGWTPHRSDIDDLTEDIPV